MIIDDVYVRGMHHLINAIFHIMYSILLFTVMRRMTGSHWRSAFVAAIKYV
jgi:hypothetical protein